MQLATAYLRGSVVVTHSASQTTAGVWIASDPVSRCDAANSDCVGRAVIDALAASESGVPHPSLEEMSRLFNPVLRVAEVSTWRTFAARAKCVQISSDGVRAILRPMTNRGKDGFEPKETQPQVAELAVLDIANALLCAFQDAD
jgi:hypothetical protein